MDDIGDIGSISRRVGHLRDDGITPKTLLGPGYSRPYHGLRRPQGCELEQPAQRIADAIGLMTKGCVLTGWASRFIQGQVYNDGESFGREHPVTILCGPGSHLRQRKGIRPRERRWLPGEVVDLGDGLIVTTMARATYDDMLDAANQVEALVSVEMATSTVIEHARTSLDNIRRVFNAHVKTRGRRQAGWALDHACTRSASPWETRTRMLATDAVGYEHWRVNIPLFDLRENLLGIGDLLDPVAGYVIESDGADHRRVTVHDADNVREERFENHGLEVVRIGAAQHSRAERPTTIERIRDGRDRARRQQIKLWTTDKPAWWWDWPPGRRWD